MASPVLSSALPGLTWSLVTYQPGGTRLLGPPELTTMVTYLGTTSDDQLMIIEHQLTSL